MAAKRSKREREKPTGGRSAQKRVEPVGRLT